MNNTWRVGRGIADITGEPWGVGMMGYGMPEQQSWGIVSRQYARAFVLDDGLRRVVFVVADIGMFFQAAVDEIHRLLKERFADRYGAHNVVLTATHTHCGPGGHGHDMLYNVTTAGFHERTFTRITRGIVAAICHAEVDVSATDVTVSIGELRNASANRAQAAFDRNPSDERDLFPGAIDPQTTLLRFERDGTLVGTINWFAVHNTSMTNKNRFISSDNKGWAAYEWEREVPGLVAAFAQTNAGDLSPNLELRPGMGPTDDDLTNTRIIGQRQLAAAQQLAQEPGEHVTALLDVRHTYVQLAKFDTTEGRTGRAILGASFAAGKLTDGPGSPLFDEGLNNPIPRKVSRWLYRRSPRLCAAHEPKEMFLPIGPMKWAQEIFLLQLVRIGHLYLVCLPFEVTVVAGWRMRRAVADTLGVAVDHVLLQGYANGYGHYVTTPQEYDEQLYEGGATVFGRHELAALTHSVTVLAKSMSVGKTIDPGQPPAPRKYRLNSPTGSLRWWRRAPLRVVHAPTRGSVGSAVHAVFTAEHPNATFRHTYLRVEEQVEGTWEQIATDASDDTRIQWRRDHRLRFTARVTWVPRRPGIFRLVYVGPRDIPTPPIAVA